MRPKMRPVWVRGVGLDTRIGQTELEKIMVSYKPVTIQVPNPKASCPWEGMFGKVHEQMVTTVFEGPSRRFDQPPSPMQK
jgi:hypothetical protein